MAHIIMAYKDPSQIERLVKTMSHPDFDFYIHVDAKFDQQPFEYLHKSRGFILSGTAGRFGGQVIVLLSRYLTVWKRS
jgi:hypothetical protein